jgi:carbon-monoxide dehydrogenase medium subunit
MKPAPFEYYAPTTVDEAVTLLRELGDEEPKLLAGGQSLVPAMNLRLARPTSIVDLNRTDGLTGIARDGDRWEIGAMTRHAAVEDSAELRAGVPVLAAAVAHIGYRPIRNRGTVGGSICHADPAAEWPLLVRLLRAEVCLRSAAGIRTVPADQLFEGVYTTTIRDDELLTSVRFAAPEPPWRWGFAELTRTAGDFAIAAVGALLRTSDGTISDASLVASGVGATPIRLGEAEAALAGAALDDTDAARRAAAAAADAVDPTDDVHASARYKRGLVAVMVERVLAQARQRPAEGSDDAG